MDTSENPKIMEIKGVRVSRSEIDELLVQMKQDNYTELWGHFFLKTRRPFRASSVGDCMLQASFQQNQEARYSFQQA